MADALGIATSTIAVIDMSAKVISLCSQYFKDVKNAKEDVTRLEREVFNLKTVSESLLQLLGTRPGRRLKTSQELWSTLLSSRVQLRDLTDTLESRSKKYRKWLKLQALKWPFDSSEITDLVYHLARFTQVISLSLQVDQTVTLLDMDQKMVLDKLPVVEGAIFNSHAEEHCQTCLEGTRTDVLHIIRNWAEDSLPVRPLFWLNGMAGTGKSTISRTVARSLLESGYLGASFFFKRGENDRSEISKVFPTIAAQLVRREPALAPYVKEAIDNDSGIFGERVEEQFDKLILIPLSKIPPEERTGKVLVIIIDALDECEREEDIRLLISLLSRVNQQRLLMLRIFVTSRPELPIRLGFSTSTIKGAYLDLTLHTIPEPVVSNDLKTYFTYELAEVRYDYNNTVSEDRKLPPNWPGEAVIEDLAKIASPLFIFAATVCRFLADRRNGTPDAKLHKVLQYETRSQESKLDATYLPVLDQMIAGLSSREENEALQEFRDIVGSIIVVAFPLSTLTLARLLNIPRSTIDGRLDLLHSVLSVPSSPNSRVRLLHLSFHDFLVDPEKRGRNPFWVDEKQAHGRLATECLRILNETLRKDICEVRWPGTTQKSIDPSVILEKLPAEVQYACRFWVYHLDKSNGYADNRDQVHILIKHHFFHWMEALCLFGRLKETRFNTKALYSFLQDDHDASDLADFVSDSRAFARYVADCDEPLQIYSKAALFNWQYRPPCESDLPD